MKNDYNIVIFTQVDCESYNSENVYCTNNLQEYASFLHSENCIALISVWSGGGQMGSFCNNTKTIMYFDKRQCITTDTVDLYKTNPNGFDFCHLTNSKRIFIKEEELSNIYNILLCN